MVNVSEEVCLWKLEEMTECNDSFIDKEKEKEDMIRNMVALC